MKINHDKAPLPPKIQPNTSLLLTTTNSPSFWLEIMYVHEAPRTPTQMLWNFANLLTILSIYTTPKVNFITQASEQGLGANTLLTKEILDDLVWSNPLKTQ